VAGCAKTVRTGEHKRDLCTKNKKQVVWKITYFALFPIVLPHLDLWDGNLDAGKEM